VSGSIKKSLFTFILGANKLVGGRFMSRKKKPEMVSIRFRIDQDLLDKIDQIAGERGRQKYIYDAIVWRLDEELPPIVFDLIRDVDDLKGRVDHLESSRSTSVQLSELNDVARNDLCTDELDRKLLAYFIRNEGATTPEIARNLLGDSNKRRTVLDRIDRLNNRAKSLFGAPVLEYEKGFKKNKRGAWWIIGLEYVVV
jgi:predicted transcriptional regulator